MAKLTGNKSIEFIQGDSYSYRISFQDATIVPLLENVVFTCKKLDICENMVFGNNEYIYTFSDEITREYSAMTTSFDITLKFLNGNILSQTGIRLIIVKKQNPTCEEHS